MSAPAARRASAPAAARHGRAVRALHWSTAAALAVMLAAIWTAAAVGERAPEAAERLTRLHVSLGALVLAATVARLGLRAWRAPPPSRTAWRARLVHGALYALLLAAPVVGWLKLAALGFEVRAFGVVVGPPLATDVALAKAARDAHWVAGYALLALAALHAAAALRRGFKRSPGAA